MVCCSFAFRRTISVVAAIDRLKFFAADRTGERGFFMRDFSLRVNSFVLVFGDKLKVGNVVVVVIEVAVVNFATVGNFAVEIRPNETVDADCATEIFARVLVKLQAAEFFLSFADGFNRQHVAADLANHLFDGKRFLRSLDALAQEFE